MFIYIYIYNIYIIIIYIIYIYNLCKSETWLFRKSLQHKNQTESIILMHLETLMEYGFQKFARVYGTSHSLAYTS